jgi:hypothetical protein
MPRVLSRADLALAEGPHNSCAGVDGILPGRIGQAGAQNQRSERDAHQSRRRLPGEVDSPGASAGSQAIEDLCRRLNQRIKAGAYRVTPEFLEMRGTATHPSSQPICGSSASACPAIRDVCRAAREKASSMMQVLARPFRRQRFTAWFPTSGTRWRPVRSNFQWLRCRRSPRPWQ